MDIVWILILCIHRPDPRVPYVSLSPRFLAGDNTGPDHYGVRCVGVLWGGDWEMSIHLGGIGWKCVHGVRLQH